MDIYARSPAVRTRYMEFSRFLRIPLINYLVLHIYSIALNVVLVKLQDQKSNFYHIIKQLIQFSCFDKKVHNCVLNHN